MDTEKIGKKKIFSTDREAAPCIMDAFFKLWGNNRIKEFYNLTVPHDDIFWIFLRDDKAHFQLHLEKFGFHIINYFMNEKNFKLHEEIWKKSKIKIEDVWNRYCDKMNISHLNNEQLIDLLNNCQNLLLETLAVIPGSVMIGDAADQLIEEYSKKKESDFSKLNYHKRSKSFVIQNEIYESLANCSNQKELDEIINKFKIKYGYLKSSFKGYSEYTKKDIMESFNKMKELSTNTDKKLIDFLSYARYVRDERMHYEQMMITLIDWCIYEISERYKVEYDLLKFSLYNEITLAKLSDPLYLAELKGRYENGLFVYSVNGEETKYETVKNNEAVDFLLGLVIPTKKDILEGISASFGKIIGRVKIIKNHNDPIPQEPHVLVLPMLTPAFVSYLNKCLAIITDEGGATSHGAILAREFNIPCVVGTQSATKLLKDGLLVEVDADKGIVKILE